MYSVTETNEEGNLCVTAHPGIWKKGVILSWPPPGSGVSKMDIISPGPDWIQYKCRVLRDNIETFKEAEQVERMYTKHRDSNSFREHQIEEQKQKKYKRDHPVNANISDLIDMNGLVNEIDTNAAEAAAKTSTPNAGAEPSKQSKSYHKQCLEKPSKTSITRKTTGVNRTNRVPMLKKMFKTRTSNVGKREAHNSKLKTPRYPNYLKSGKNSVPTITKVDRTKPKQTKEKSTPAATITKADYINLNGGDEIVSRETAAITNDDSRNLMLASGVTQKKSSNIHSVVDIEYDREGTEYNKSKPDSIRLPLSDQEGSYNYCGSNQIVNGSYFAFGNYKPDSQIQANAPVGNTSFEQQVIKHLTDIKNAQKKSEDSRLLFEARMVLKLDAGINSIVQSQGQNQNRAQMQQPEPEPSDQVHFTDEDFDELDTHYPIKRELRVENLERTIRQDLNYKLLLKSRFEEFVCKKNPKKTVRGIMTYLITDQVLDRYTWCGTSDLEAFKKFTSINNLIYRTARTKEFKRTDYDRYMVQWLKHSTTRQRTVTYTYPNRRNVDENVDEDEDDDDESDNDE